MSADETQYEHDVDLARRASAAYYCEAEPIITDSEFDALLEAIQAFEAAHPESVIQHDLFTRPGGDGGDVTHERPMLSLDKVKDLAAVRAFVQRITAAGSLVQLEPKLDGLAVCAEYADGHLVRVSTRGDGHTGEDITARVRALQVTGLPHALDGVAEIRGELLMSHKDFLATNMRRVRAGHAAFANPRNAIAGTVRASALDYVSDATFITYDVPGTTADAPALPGLIRSVDLMVEACFADADALLERLERFGTERTSEDYPYPTDGIVLKTVDAGLREHLGHTSRAPRWAMAYKYEATSATTVLRDIVMGVGRTGNISFTGVFDPVTVDGSTIGRATLHNFDYIRSRDIRIGDHVEVYKANDVIPRIERSFPALRSGAEQVYEPERVSPVSNSALDTSEVIWRSTDPSDSLGSWISYAVSRDCFDIEGIGGEIAAALVDANLVDDIGDLFFLQEDDLAGLRLSRGRFLGEKNAVKIVAEIERAKVKPLARVITALGIRKSGRTFGRRLAAHFHTMEALQAASETDLLEVEGVGPERVRLFREGLERLTDVIAKLSAAGVNMGEDPTAATDAASQPLAGMTVVVTGAMTGPLAGRSRNEMNELIESLGGKASGSVSKNTSLLVCGEEGSSKWVKANTLGIRIVSPEAFASEVGL
ncbi:NAD-dependent DNA ligase LigA [Pseudoclavibacter soli]|uniref:NAD-dependent DNA ligase LigA n=1 Tax=Pseudoclavibacter soli TaxID=452623 RepID=UPI00041E7F7F|nr:NAD-dependent DNA ligase LigA [Pseudoclavibacter soli]